MKDSVRDTGPLTALPIHAGAVRTDGGALLFLGPQETGKSTVRLLVEYYMPSLADDLVYLVPQVSGEWGVAPANMGALDGPSEAADIAPLYPVRLRAVLRLYRSTEPRLEKISALKTCRYLVDAFFEIGWPRDCPVETKRAAFANLAAVTRKVSGYCLYFDRSARTCQVLADEFLPR